MLRGSSLSYITCISFTDIALIRYHRINYRVGSGKVVVVIWAARIAHDNSDARIRTFVLVPAHRGNTMLHAGLLDDARSGI
jgi:hypothetical protein